MSEPFLLSDLDAAGFSAGEGIRGKKLVKAGNKTIGNGSKSSAILEEEGIIDKKLVKAVKEPWTMAANHRQCSKRKAFPVRSLKRQSTNPWAMAQIIGNAQKGRHSW